MDHDEDHPEPSGSSGEARDLNNPNANRESNDYRARLIALGILPPPEAERQNDTPASTSRDAFTANSPGPASFERVNLMQMVDKQETAIPDSMANNEHRARQKKHHKR